MRVRICGQTSEVSNFICCLCVILARARNNVARPAVVPQMQTGPEALAAQVTQYKSTTVSPTSDQGIVRAQVPQPQLQQFPEGTVICQLMSQYPSEKGM